MAKHSANEPNRLRWMGLSALVALVVVAGAVVISLIGGRGAGSLGAPSPGEAAFGQRPL